MKLNKLFTSTNSCVSLKGEFSNPIFFPGELDRMNPKSIWMMWPCASSKILPLCLEEDFQKSMKYLFTKEYEYINMHVFNKFLKRTFNLFSKQSFLHKWNNDGEKIHKQKFYVAFMIYQAP